MLSPEITVDPQAELGQGIDNRLKRQVNEYFSVLLTVSWGRCPRGKQLASLLMHKNLNSPVSRLIVFVGHGARPKLNSAGFGIHPRQDPPRYSAAPSI